MKVRITQYHNGFFYIEEFRDLSFYGRTGVWLRCVSYTRNQLNELNYFHSFEEAKSALDRMISNMKNPKPDGIVHLECKI